MKSKNIEILDQKIINELIKDSKQSLREIAQKVNVSFVTVKNRINKLEKTGIIKKYTAIIDASRIGYETHVLIEVRIAKGRLFELEKKIARHPSIYAVYDISGDFDALIFGRFKSTRAMDKFLKEIQKYEFIERTRTKLILNTIKNQQIEI